MILLGIAIALITVSLIASVVIDAAHEPPEEPWDPWADAQDLWLEEPRGSSER